MYNVFMIHFLSARMVYAIFIYGYLPGKIADSLADIRNILYPFTAFKNVNENELKGKNHTVIPEREARGAAATRQR